MDKVRKPSNSEIWKAEYVERMQEIRRKTWLGNVLENYNLEDRDGDMRMAPIWPFLRKLKIILGVDKKF
jgi:hypothetical protein